MERDRWQGGGSQSEAGRDAAAPDPRTLTILRRYSAGALSAREAAREIGSGATEHDVFAGIRAAQLPLPEPSPEELASQVAALLSLYGPHGATRER